MSVISSTANVEQWGIFEVALQGSAEGNPFLEVELSAQFRHKHRTIDVDGFYDGEGVYRVRFMPDTQGEWSYTTRSNRAELNGVEGTFSSVAPAAHNHGPVQVANTYHFAYADGKPYKQIGTTCYAWVHQGDEMEEQTLETLRTAPFNKLRMCVFPKHYAYNENEPERYPFPCLSRGSSKWTGSWWGDEKSGWSFDFSRFDPAFFQHFEQRVAQLQELGIEADLILFHPYDRWGFATMDAETDDRYLRYVVARLAAYRNVWWSMANEYDLMRSKTMADWDRFFRVVQEADPYQHLRSIHNCFAFYDHSKPWVTHLSIQRSDLEQTNAWREQYRKPAVIDECCYEGNIPQHWGNISMLEMVHRFWEGTARGGYVGHGDTFLHPQDLLWWAKGGKLYGQSAPRLAFLRKILEEGPAAGLEPIDGVTTWRWHGPACAGQDHEYYLIYCGRHQPAQLTINVPEGEEYKGEVIDIEAMTVTPLSEPVVRGSVVALPGKPYQALRVQRVHP
jgi:hypothetical protein